MATATLSTQTIVTLIAVFAFIMMLYISRRTLSAVVTALVVSIIILIAYEAVTGTRLINLNEIWHFLWAKILQLFAWVESTLLPKLNDVAYEIENVI